MVLWFEGSLQVENSYDHELKSYDSCELEIDYAVTPLETKLNYDASQAAVEERLEIFKLNGNSFYSARSDDSFDSNIGLIFENLTVSTRFLLCVLLSYILINPCYVATIIYCNSNID